MNTIGRYFRVTNWGESHGKAIGVVIDGCPSGINISEKDFIHDMQRRRPRQSEITTQRNEKDHVEILSGVFMGKTTGTPISLIIYNEDCNHKDYSELSKIYRPGHADFTYDHKYSVRDYRGGGRSSGRITAGSVAAGVIAKKILSEKLKLKIFAFSEQIGKIKFHHNYRNIDFSKINSNVVRCPDKISAQKMLKEILEVKEKGDSLGGIVACIVKKVPVGLGEPIFGKMNAELAKSILSINGSRGIEFGSGFRSANLTGSELNDTYVKKNGNTETSSNNCGGILGGITTGSDINFRVVFKPTPSISKTQKTVNTNGDTVNLSINGRHDPCIIPRVVPVVEAMTAITICDLYLSNTNPTMIQNY